MHNRPQQMSFILSELDGFVLFLLFEVLFIFISGPNLILASLRRFSALLSKCFNIDLP